MATGWRARAALAAALALCGAQPLAAASLDPFFGAWQGVELVEGGEGLFSVPAELGAVIAPAGDGFALQWTVPGAGPVDARFRRSERPGVYYAERGNPLDGELLLWARLADDALIVYSLILNDQGGFALDRYAYALTEESGMMLRFTRLRDGRPAGDVNGRLVPAG